MNKPDLIPSQTLARLSFWVPPGRMAEFEAAYEAKVAPILKRHGLVESSERGRATVAGGFSRLFEVETPSEVEEKRRALQGDPTFQAVLQDLGTAFGTAGLDNLIQYDLGFYAAPAGPGRVMSAGSGKVTAVGSGRGHWRTYDVADGLTGVLVQSIFQDREGYLWFGTYGGGVSRYDGRTFITFTTQDGLAHNVVLAIFQDREGYLWFGTEEGGVSRYDPSTSSGQGGKTWTTFTAQDGLGHNWVSSIFQDREGYLWFGTYGGGVSRYDPPQLADARSGQVQTPDSALRSGQASSASSELALPVLSTVEGSETKGHGFITFTQKDGLTDNRVSSIFQDREGYFWFGTNGGGVSRHDGQAWTTFTTQDGLAHNVVLSVFQDREGYLWFGTETGGVSRYDGKTFVTFTTQDGLAHNVVLSVFQDREGYLWFGTRGGVSRYDGGFPSTLRQAQGSGQSFTTFTTQDGLAHNVVPSIFQDQEGHLWFGTYGGVSRYDEKTFITFTTQDGLAHNWVPSMFRDQEGHLWFGTAGGGVIRYGEKSFTTFTAQNGLADNVVRSIFQDREGYLWFGTNGGVSRYDGKSPSTDSGQSFTTFTTQDGLAHNWVPSIFQDREGYLWFGTYGGVSRYDGRVPSTLRQAQGSGQSFTTFTTQDGLAHNEVRSIFQDREGHLWFATYGGGVSRFDGKSPPTLRQAQGSEQGFTTFTTKDGLAGNWVYSIFQDREGHLWFATNGGGVSRYDGQVFQTILQQDGLASNVVWSVLQDREGEVWFGTNKGVTRYHLPTPSPPPAFIDAVVADRRYEGERDLVISSSVEMIAFDFRGISFKTRPGALMYRYRMKGYDEGWKIAREHRAEYQGLPLGTYTFEVQAVDRDLVYSEKPATVRLTVVRDPRDEQIDELEQRVRERTRALEEANERLKELDRLKNDFVSNVSHDLRTPLTSIKGYVDNMLDGIGGALNDRQVRNLQRIRSNADRLSKLVNDILDLSRIEAGRLEIAPTQVSVAEVGRDVAEGLRQMASEKGVALGVVEGDEGVVAFADPDRVHQILMNLMGNAIKFTESGGRVEVGAESDGAFVRVWVRDTGKGIPSEELGRVFDKFHQVGGSSEAQRGAGLGLSIVKALVELHGGRIWAESEVGRGSTFWFTLPNAKDAKGTKDAK